MARALFDEQFLRTLVAEHRNGGTPRGTQLWLLINLEIWQRIFIDGEDTASVMAAVRHFPLADSSPRFARLGMTTS